MMPVPLDLGVDVATALNELAELFDTTLLRSVVTVAALGILAGIGWVSTQVQSWLRERLSDFTADAVTVVVVGLTFASAVAVIIGVWDVADDVKTALADLSLGQNAGPQIAVTIVVIVVAVLLSRAARRVVRGLIGRRSGFGEHEVEVVSRVIQVILWVATFSVVLGIWEVDLTGVLVGAGFAGIVVGMAARQTLGAVLAGFVLMFARPFEIGDWVEIGEREGIVTDISIVNTRVQTFDGEYVMIPNDIVSGQEVVNRSRKGRLRIEVEVGVDYDADVQYATELAGEAMDDLDEVLSVPTPQVIVKEFGSSAIVLGCRFWIDKPSARRKWRARTAVVQAVKDAFDEAGVKIPYPQRELSGREETGGFRHAPSREAEILEDAAPFGDADAGADEDEDASDEAAADESAATAASSGDESKQAVPVSREDGGVAGGDDDASAGTDGERDDDGGLSEDEVGPEPPDGEPEVGEGDVNLRPSDVEDDDGDAESDDGDDEDGSGGDEDGGDDEDGIGGDEDGGDDEDGIGGDVDGGDGTGDEDAGSAPEWSS